MQATITYTLTEQAQRAQIAATGQPVARKQVVTVDVATEDLGLMQVTDDGTLYLDLCPGASASEPAPIIADPLVPHREALIAAGCASGRQFYKSTPSHGPYELSIPLITDAKADVVALIKQGTATLSALEAQEKAAKLAKQETAIREYLGDGDKHKVTSDQNSGKWINAIDVSNYQGPLAEEYRAEFAKRMAAYRAEQAAIIDRRKLAEAEKAAKEAVIEESKTAAIDAFIAASGDELLIQQHADGLLCRKTIISRMAAAALDAAGLPEATATRTCKDHDCPCQNLEIDCIPPAVYARWKAIGELPAGSTFTFYEVRNCRGLEEDWDENDDRADKTEYHAVVTLQSGPFQFKRRIRL